MRAVQNFKEQPALIFIPDISGFTKFIHETEVQHSTHIITELLEILIDANMLGLELSEIEGDAVLFYKKGELPPFKKIVQQCEVMFIKFHQHLKLYKRDRVCQCGACSGAENLTLKFVIHYGSITIRQIQNHLKLMGPDVTLAHRLLKNNITIREYMLLSGKQTELTKSHDPSFNWIKIQENSTEYEEFGIIDYKYISLTALHDRVQELPERPAAKKYKNPLSVSIIIESPQKFVHSIITDLSLKPKWMFGVKKIKKGDDKVDRVGTRHECFLPFMTLNIETIQNMVIEGRVEYAEQSQSTGIMPSVTHFFIIERLKGEQSRFTTEIHYNRPPLIGWMIDLIARPLNKAGLRKTAMGLKVLCEERYQQWKEDQTD